MSDQNTVIVESAEIPPLSPATCYAASLRLIKRSSLMDFETSAQWGQWCRTVAMAALEEDLDKLEWLERELDPPHNTNMSGPSDGSAPRTG